MEDWPRHKKNCIPVMVKEYGEKGRGLVAAKNIKMGELILTDKAVVSKDDIGTNSNISTGFRLTHDADRLLINQKILKDISLLNHSCAPNAAMGLLDGKEIEEPEKRFELRAVKNISKEEEVTIFYPPENVLPWLHVDMRKTIQEDFGFDCKCSVCSGEVPSQDDIMSKMIDIVRSSESFRNRKKGDEMTFLDWMSQASALNEIVELGKQIYMGREEAKMRTLWLLAGAAIACNNSALFKKALEGAEELAEKTGLTVFVKEIENERENLHYVAETIKRSTSPQITTVNTVEELKEMLSRDGSVKFIVTPELQNTDEYKDFMEDYNKQTEEDEN